MPALAAASRRYRSLAEAAGSLLPPPVPVPAGTQDRAPAGTRSGGPVFTTLAGGLGLLPAFLAKASGAEIRTASMTRALSQGRRAGGSRSDRRRRRN